MRSMRMLAGGAGGLVVAAVTLSVALSAGPAQTATTTAVPPKWVPEGDTARMLNDIKPANVEATVRKLVSFGTRATGSSQTDPNRGIGAARDWIKGEFDMIAATSGGRMTVALDSYVQQPGSRIPVPTTI